MSSPSLQRIRQSITHQTSTWPKDVLRPQVQFSTTLQTLVDQRLDGFEQRGEPVGTDELEALDGLQKALRDLKSNRWRDKVSPLLSIQPVLGADLVADPTPLHPPLFLQYPLTEKSLIPASKPTYYFRMQDAIDRAQRGEGKPWWRNFMGLEAAGLEERIKTGELDARIGLKRKST